MGPPKSARRRTGTCSPSWMPTAPSHSTKSASSSSATTRTVAEAPRDALRDLARTRPRKAVSTADAPADHDKVERIGHPRDDRVGVPDGRPEQHRRFACNLLQNRQPTLQIAAHALLPAQG